MNQRIAIAASLLAAFGTAHGADVYRSTGPDGTVTYSDRPQGSDAQFVFAAATRSADGRTAAPPASPNTAGTAPEAAATPPRNVDYLRNHRSAGVQVAIANLVPP